MKRTGVKANRISQIETLLLAHPNGLTQAEIARRLGVHRSTILRNLADINGPVYEDHGRLFIDREAFLVHVHFNLHEAMTIHLAARLFATRADRQNPHAAAALRKLGLAIERLAPRISRHILDSAGWIERCCTWCDPLYLQVLEKLTVAWAEGRQARIWYRKGEAEEVKEYCLCPYFIEAYAIGQTSYVIGRVEPPGHLRTFKIERIERIELLRQGYQIPDDFDPEALFADAWGIWFTGHEPVEVTLRFSPRVAARVRETRWHRSQQVEPLPGGGLLWRARIAEPQEMMPWVRGWGSDCEVLAPEEMRAEIQAEARRLIELYGEDQQK
jgi:predicted DNA-binding transcriptional regulator YafY